MRTTLRGAGLVFAGTLLVPYLAPPTALGNADTFNTNGAYASAQFRTGALECWLSVGRDESGSSRQTFLWYDCYDTVNFNIVEGGSGPIPNGQFTISGNTRRLTVDTRTLPDFNQWTGAGGAFALVWTKDSLYVRTETGSTRVRAPQSMFRFKGTWVYTHASVAGTALGAPVQFIDGSLGTSKVAVVTVEHP